MDPLAQLDGWPVPSAAACVVEAGGTLTERGRGTATPWASVTKVLSALVVLEAVQDGLVDLDAAAGPPGSTVRHLLAHASGLAPEGDVVLAGAGERRIYSNRGFEVLGALVEQRAGQPFPDRLRERITGPLGMGGTTLDGSPASDAAGPVEDLGLLGAELLAPTLLRADLAVALRTVAFPGLRGVLPGYGRCDPNDWGLGVEIRDAKDPHWTGSHNSPATFGHFGQSGSFLWVDPDAGLACGVLTGRAFGPWAVPLWPRLSDDVLEAAGAA